MPWSKKSKSYQVQKLEKAHQVLLSDGRRFEAMCTKKAENLSSLLSYMYKEVKGKRESVMPSSSWSLQILPQVYYVKTKINFLVDTKTKSKAEQKMLYHDKILKSEGIDEQRTGLDTSKECDICQF